MCVEAVVTGSTWRGGEVCPALDHLSPSLMGWGAREGGAERQGFLLCPATEELPSGYGDRAPQFYDSVDSSCQGRPIRPLAPGSFRVEICDAGWTLGFLPLWDTQEGGGLGGDCWGLGWAVSGVRMAEAPMQCTLEAPLIIKHQRREEECGPGLKCLLAGVCAFTHH